MRSFALALILLTLGCSHSPNNGSGFKTLDLHTFTIEVPNSWTYFPIQGLDSYVGGVAIGNGDTLTFDYGYYSNQLKEVGPESLRKQNFRFDSIGGFEAKIVFPRRAGTGVTGVYFDSVGVGGMGKKGLNLYGEDLSKDNEQALLKAILTIKIIESK